MSSETPWETGVISFVSGQGWATIKPDSRQSNADDVHVPRSMCLAFRTGTRVRFQRVTDRRGWMASAVRVITGYDGE